MEHAKIMMFENMVQALRASILSGEISVEVALSLMENIKKGKFSFDFNQTEMSFFKMIQAFICPPTENKFLKNTLVNGFRHKKARFLISHQSSSRFGLNPQETESKAIAIYSRKFSLNFDDFLEITPRTLEEKTLTRNQIISIIRNEHFQKEAKGCMSYFLSKIDEKKHGPENLVIVSIDDGKRLPLVFGISPYKKGDVWSNNILKKFILPLMIPDKSEK